MEVVDSSEETNNQNLNPHGAEGTKKVVVEKEKVNGKTMEDVAMENTNEEEKDCDDVSTQTTIRMNPGTKINKNALHFIQRLIRFHGRKYSRRNDLKITLEASKNGPAVQLSNDSKHSSKDEEHR